MNKVLLLILTLGIAVRFINFSESIYFGYDEARDAFISQDIYLKGELKLVGPTASAIAGVNHGPLYYYILGPLFLLNNGDPYLASIFFRLLNAAGIIGVYFIGKWLLDRSVGLISAFIYAVSYEQFIYAIFTGNPAVSNVAWIISFLGVAIVYKFDSKKVLGLTLMFLGAATAAQFDMVSGILYIPVLLILLALKNRLSGIKLSDWAKILIFGNLPLITYLVAEIKFGFNATKTLLQTIASGDSIVRAGESVWSIFTNNLLGLFRDNILDLSLSDTRIGLLMGGALLYLLFKSKKDVKYSFFVIWVLSMSALMLTRGFMPMYSYAGVGIGLIIGVSILLRDISKKIFPLTLFILAVVTFSNIYQIIPQSKKSLVVEIKAQPDMRLVDEIALVQETYSHAKDQGFTIRTTSMPYRIQTVWAYLYQQYGYKEYGYLPYFENRNVAGYPGLLPEPQKGTTCVRYLIREPVRGIPENLIQKDEIEENYFSDLLSEKKFGQIILQTRLAKDPLCHGTKP